MQNQFQLIDLSVLDDQDIRQQKQAALFQLILKHARDRDFYQYIVGLLDFKWFIGLLECSSEHQVLASIEYMLNLIEEDKHQALFKSLEDRLPNKAEATMPSIADMFRRQGREEGMQYGMQQGVQQGMQQGIALQKQNTARQMFKEGMDLQTISRCTGVPIATLKTWQSS